MVRAAQGLVKSKYGERPLKRIVKNADDLAFILDAVPSENSGLTLCTGSLGVAFENDVPAIARRFARRRCGRTSRGS